MSAANGLLGFIQKKSLFENSPHMLRSRRRSKSRSRGEKESIIRKVNDFEDTQQSRFIQRQSGHCNQNQSRKEIVYYDSENGTHPTNNLNRSQSRFLQHHQNDNYFAKKSEQQLDIPNKQVPISEQKQLPYSMSFESARIQSAQCLETLSSKLTKQISNIDNRINEFRANMSHILAQQLCTLKEKIVIMVESAFRQSQNNMKIFMEIEEQRLAGDLLMWRNTLQQEYVKIEAMKQEIHKPQWRKYAGQILSSNLQKHIQQEMQQLSAVQIEYYTPVFLNQPRLKTFQRQLGQLLRFRQ